MASHMRDAASKGKRGDFYVMVGEAIRARRLEQGLSYREIAGKVGCSTSTIQNAELGFSLSLHMFVLIAEELDVPLDALVPLEAT
jgi:transcriptional regulator with XRE-family HTH domain